MTIYFSVDQYLCLTLSSSSSWTPFISTPGLDLKEEWNSTGMLRRQNTMSALLFWVPNVLWVTLRQGGLSMVPSILVTCKHKQIFHPMDSVVLPFCCLNGLCSYCNVVVVFWHVDKSRQTLAEPHRDLSVHVDSKGFKSLLKATCCVVLEGASIFPQVHATHLSQTETTNWNKSWQTAQRKERREEGRKRGV